MKLFQSEDFLNRVLYAISEEVPITLIVGSPISFDYTNRTGVADVSKTIDRIRNSFKDDPSALEKLNKSLIQPGSNPYQKAFEYLLAVRGAKYANGIIRSTVLEARRDSDFAESDPSKIGDEEWLLSPALEAIGRLLAENPQKFSNRVLTTNFDPLIEAAIRRSGGTCYSTFYHRDGNPATTNADGVNVIHLHGFWHGSDTLHTPYQLKQTRPQLKNYLLDLFRKTLVVVVAYGGWDDVIGSCIEEVVRDDGSDHEILWAFKSKELSHLQLTETHLFERLKPGLERGRVQIYGGVDCHDIFPMMVTELSARNPLLQYSSNAREPITQPLTAAEKMLANVVGIQTERHADTTPRINGFVGRNRELSALGNADASVISISGFGGQGKTILAAKYLSDFNEEILKDWRDCREEGNTAHTALALYLERLSKGMIKAESLYSAPQRDLIELIVSHGSTIDSVLVLDNIDTYVDLDTQRPTGVIGMLCDRILETQTRIRIVLTCRPCIQIASSQFFSLPIEGLDEPSVISLFSSKSAAYELNSQECSALMRLTEGHPLYISMLAAQRLSSSKSLTQILDEVAAAKSDVPAIIMRSTYKLLKPEQTEVLRILAELERPEHEGSLEEVTGQRYNKLSKSLKRLKDLSLILERRDMSDKTLIDLHPLVRQFLRREYPQKDREAFISRIILYFNRKIALVAKSLGTGQIPKKVMDIWIHKIEVLCNTSDWVNAISELKRIASELGRSGLNEDFIRLGLRIFQGVDWLVAVEECKDFRSLINEICHELSHHGDHCDVEKWAKHYIDAVGGRGADKINVLEFLAYNAWLQRDFTRAIEMAKESVQLLRLVDISLPTSPIQTLALALRDSGDVDGALNIFLEGHSLEDALIQGNDKSSEFFGNIGRSLYLKGEYSQALQFYRMCGRRMENNPRTKHNMGWVRLWVGEALVKTGRATEGYALLCAAKYILTGSSRLLEMAADSAIEAIEQNHPDIDFSSPPEWQVEKLYHTWLAQE